jgi:molybdopterin synthase sulfur carrier subunit
MKVNIRFFALFGELLGKNVVVDTAPGTSFTDLIRDVAGKNEKGYDAIFDESGKFRGYVILMKNGKRLRPADADTTYITEGDEIAVFPPVAGG